MEITDLPTDRRLEHMYRANPSFTQDDLKRVYYAFEKLIILQKSKYPEDMKEQEAAFYRDLELYKERLTWINEFMRSKGFDETLFRNISSFQTSSDDYDYYYELKTPKQLEEDEAKRKNQRHDEMVGPTEPTIE